MARQTPKEHLTPEQERLLHPTGPTGESESKDKQESSAKAKPAEATATKDKDGDKDKSTLADHVVPETHLSEAQKEGATKPGADVKSEGISHATSVLAGAAGQAQGLPTPLPAAEAEEKGFTPKSED